jgi:hypothetical protein
MAQGPEAEFVAEVRRIQERYTVEVVERFNLCPWARPARLAGAVERPVLLQRDTDPAPMLEAIRALEEDPRNLTVAIAAYPRLRVTPREFDVFAAEVRRLDQARHGGKPVFVVAAFHPDYPLDARSPARLVTFLRRAPDPSLQLVRLSVLEEARGRDPQGKFVFDFSTHAWEELLRRNTSKPVSERIADENLATFERVGADAIEEVLRDIAADRARSYARFGA